MKKKPKYPEPKRCPACNSKEGFTNVGERDDPFDPNQIIVTYEECKECGEGWE